MNKAEKAAYDKIYRAENREKILEYKRLWHKKNASSVSKKKAFYREKNKQKIAESKRRYQQENKEYLRNYQLKYRAENKESLAQSKREYNKKNKGKIAAHKREYYSKNKHKANQYVKNRLRTDPCFRAIWNARNRVRKFIYGKTKFSKMLGCTQDQFTRHIESQFQPGMSWENYGYRVWHLDHKYPLSKAYLEGPESFAKACHYTNLQPLWAADNMAKSDKVPQSLK